MKKRYFPHVTTSLSLAALVVSLFSLSESRALHAESLEKAEASCKGMKDHDLRQDCLYALKR